LDAHYLNVWVILLSNIYSKATRVVKALLIPCGAKASVRSGVGGELHNPDEFAIVTVRGDHRVQKVKLDLGISAEDYRINSAFRVFVLKRF